MRILLSAGEVSGDRIGALLATAIAEIDPAAELAGCAGRAMAATGVRPLADPAVFSHSGWESVLTHAPRILWAAWRYLRSALAYAPDLVVAVDAPGIHAPLLDRFRRKGVRCAWVAPPQLWAWRDRRPSVLRGLRVFPLHEFEVDALREAGAEPLWHGYPGPRGSRQAGIRDLLVLLPGSREAWRRRHVPLFLEAAREADTGLEPVFVHPSPTSSRERGLACLSPEMAFPRAALALTIPGTATLEIALRGIPAVVAARPGRLDAWLGARRLSAGPFSLPSRILGRAIYPELLGPGIRSADIARALRLAREHGSREWDPAALRGRLGPEDACDRIARSLGVCDRVR